MYHLASFLLSLLTRFLCVVLTATEITLVHQASLEFHRDLLASASLSDGMKGVPIFTIVFLRVKYSLVFTLSAPPKFTLPLPFLNILTLSSVNMTVSIAEPY